MKSSGMDRLNSKEFQDSLKQCRESEKMRNRESRMSLDELIALKECIRRGAERYIHIWGSDVTGKDNKYTVEYQEQETLRKIEKAKAYKCTCKRKVGRGCSESSNLKNKEDELDQMQQRRLQRDQSIHRIASKNVDGEYRYKTESFQEKQRRQIEPHNTFDQSSSIVIHTREAPVSENHMKQMERETVGKAPQIVGRYKNERASSTLGRESPNRFSSTSKPTESKDSKQNLLLNGTPESTKVISLEDIAVCVEKLAFSIRNLQSSENALNSTLATLNANLQVPIDEKTAECTTQVHGADSKVNSHCAKRQATVKSRASEREDVGNVEAVVFQPAKDDLNHRLRKKCKSKSHKYKLESEPNESLQTTGHEANYRLQKNDSFSHLDATSENYSRQLVSKAETRHQQQEECGSRVLVTRDNQKSETKLKMGSSRYGEKMLAGKAIIKTRNDLEHEKSKTPQDKELEYKNGATCELKKPKANLERVRPHILKEEGVVPTGKPFNKTQAGLQYEEAKRAIPQLKESDLKPYTTSELGKPKVKLEMESLCREKKVGKIYGTKAIDKTPKDSKHEIKTRHHGELRCKTDATNELQKEKTELDMVSSRNLKEIEKILARQTAGKTKEESGREIPQFKRSGTKVNATNQPREAISKSLIERSCYEKAEGKTPSRKVDKTKKKLQYEKSFKIEQHEERECKTDKGELGVKVKLQMESTHLREEEKAFYMTKMKHEEKEREMPKQEEIQQKSYASELDKPKAKTEKESSRYEKEGEKVLRRKTADKIMVELKYEESEDGVGKTKGGLQHENEKMSMYVESAREKSVGRLEKQICQQEKIDNKKDREVEKITHNSTRKLFGTTGTKMQLEERSEVEQEKENTRKYPASISSKKMSQQDDRKQDIMSSRGPVRRTHHQETDKRSESSKKNKTLQQEIEIEKKSCSDSKPHCIDYSAFLDNSVTKIKPFDKNAEVNEVENEKEGSSAASGSGSGQVVDGSLTKKEFKHKSKDFKQSDSVKRVSMGLAEQQFVSKMNKKSPQHEGIISDSDIEIDQDMEISALRGTRKLVERKEKKVQHEDSWESDSESELEKEKVRKQSTRNSVSKKRFQHVESNCENHADVVTKTFDKNAEGNEVQVETEGVSAASRRVSEQVPGTEKKKGFMEKLKNFKKGMQSKPTSPRAMGVIDEAEISKNESINKQLSKTAPLSNTEDVYSQENEEVEKIKKKGNDSSKINKTSQQKVEGEKKLSSDSKQRNIYSAFLASSVTKTFDKNYEGNEVETGKEGASAESGSGSGQVVDDSLTKKGFKQKFKDYKQSDSGTLQARKGVSRGLAEQFVNKTNKKSPQHEENTSDSDIEIDQDMEISALRGTRKLVERTEKKVQHEDSWESDSESELEKEKVRKQSTRNSVSEKRFQHVESNCENHADVVTKTFDKNAEGNEVQVETEGVSAASRRVSEQVPGTEKKKGFMEKFKNFKKGMQSKPTSPRAMGVIDEAEISKKESINKQLSKTAPLSNTEDVYSQENEEVEKIKKKGNDSAKINKTSQQKVEGEKKLSSDSKQHNIYSAFLASSVTKTFDKNDEGNEVETGKEGASAESGNGSGQVVDDSLTKKGFKQKFKEYKQSDSGTLRERKIVSIGLAEKFASKTNRKSPHHEENTSDSDIEIDQDMETSALRSTRKLVERKEKKVQHEDSWESDSESELEKEKVRKQSTRNSVSKKRFQHVESNCERDAEKTQDEVEVTKTFDKNAERNEVQVEREGASEESGSGSEQVAGTKKKKSFMEKFKNLKKGMQSKPKSPRSISVMDEAGISKISKTALPSNTDDIDGQENEEVEKIKKKGNDSSNINKTLQQKVEGEKKRSSDSKQHNIYSAFLASSVTKTFDTNAEGNEVEHEKEGASAASGSGSGQVVDDSSTNTGFKQKLKDYKQSDSGTLQARKGVSRGLAGQFVNKTNKKSPQNEGITSDSDIEIDQDMEISALRGTRKLVERTEKKVQHEDSWESDSESELEKEKVRKQSTRNSVSKKRFQHVENNCESDAEETQDEPPTKSKTKQTFKFKRINNEFKRRWSYLQSSMSVEVRETSSETKSETDSENEQHKAKETLQRKGVFSAKNEANKRAVIAKAGIPQSETESPIETERTSKHTLLKTNSVKGHNMDDSDTEDTQDELPTRSQTKVLFNFKHIKNGLKRRSSMHANVPVQGGVSESELEEEQARNEPMLNSSDKKRTSDAESHHNSDSEESEDELPTRSRSKKLFNFKRIKNELKRRSSNHRSKSKEQGTSKERMETEEEEEDDDDDDAEVKNKNVVKAKKKENINEPKQHSSDKKRSSDAESHHNSDTEESEDELPTRSRSKKLFNFKRIKNELKRRSSNHRSKSKEQGTSKERMETEAEDNDDDDDAEVKNKNVVKAKKKDQKIDPKQNSSDKKSSSDAESHRNSDTEESEDELPTRSRSKKLFNFKRIKNELKRRSSNHRSKSKEQGTSKERIETEEKEEDDDDNDDDAEVKNKNVVKAKKKENINEPKQNSSDKKRTSNAESHHNSDTEVSEDELPTESRSKKLFNFKRIKNELKKRSSEHRSKSKEQGTSKERMETAAEDDDDDDAEVKNKNVVKAKKKENINEPKQYSSEKKRSSDADSHHDSDTEESEDELTTRSRSKKLFNFKRIKNELKRRSSKHRSKSKDQGTSKVRVETKEDDDDDEKVNTRKNDVPKASKSKTTGRETGRENKEEEDDSGSGSEQDTGTKKKKGFMEKFKNLKKGMKSKPRSPRVTTGVDEEGISEEESRNKQKCKTAPPSNTEDVDIQEYEKVEKNKKKGNDSSKINKTSQQKVEGEKKTSSDSKQHNIYSAFLASSVTKTFDNNAERDEVETEKEGASEESGSGSEQVAGTKKKKGFMEKFKNLKKGMKSKPRSPRVTTGVDEEGISEEESRNKKKSKTAPPSNTEDVEKIKKKEKDSSKRDKTLQQEVEGEQKTSSDSKPHGIDYSAFLASSVTTVKAFDKNAEGNELENEKEGASAASGSGSGQVVDDSSIKKGFKQKFKDFKQIMNSKRSSSIVSSCSEDEDENKEQKQTGNHDEVTRGRSRFKLNFKFRRRERETSMEKRIRERAKLVAKSEKRIQKETKKEEEKEAKRKKKEEKVGKHKSRTLRSFFSRKKPKKQETRSKTTEPTPEVKRKIVLTPCNTDFDDSSDSSEEIEPGWKQKVREHNKQLLLQSEGTTYKKEQGPSKPAENSSVTLEDLSDHEETCLHRYQMQSARTPQFKQLTTQHAQQSNEPDFRQQQTLVSHPPEAKPEPVKTQTNTSAKDKTDIDIMNDLIAEIDAPAPSKHVKSSPMNLEDLSDIEETSHQKYQKHLASTPRSKSTKKSAADKSGLDIMDDIIAELDAMIP